MSPSRFFSYALGLAIAAALTLGHGVAVAADIKIGVVDMQKAIQTVDTGKKAKAQLEKQITDKKKDIQTEEAAIKKMTEDFKKQSLVMNDQAKAKKQAEIQERIMKYQELAGRTQQELQQREQELTEPIVSKLRAIIKDMAASKGYTVILERNDNTVLYFQDKDDLTSDVVSTFNKQNKG